MIKKHIQIETPTPLGHFLGCTHDVFDAQVCVLGKETEEGQSQGGSSKTHKVRGVSYNIENFFRQCVDKYMSLFGKKKKVAMKFAATPFVDETKDQKTSPQGAPAPGDIKNAHTCPWCCNLFEPNADTKGDRAKEIRAKLAAMNAMTPVKTTSDRKSSPKRVRLNESEQSIPDLEEETGDPKVSPYVDKVLNRDAASILMKVLYGARMGRFDLLRAINALAKRLTEWDEECDRRLYRLMCYVWSTFSYRQVGWVLPGESIDINLYTDADFAGCPRTQRSTTGIHLQLEGKITRFPLSGVSKGQSCV